MNKKKLLWILILIIAIVAVVAIVIVMNNASQSQKNNAENNTTIVANRTATEENKVENQTDNNDEKDKKSKAYSKIELSDGTLYTTTGKKEKADMVIGTNYFDTTITDIYYNPQNYLDKIIEIEGFYMTNSDGTPYTFVGRYSTNTLCPTCPSGYSVMEYQLRESIDEKFVKEDTWLKVVGYLDEGYDEAFGEYYYLDVINLEVMNEKGEMEVVN